MTQNIVHGRRSPSGNGEKGERDVAFFRRLESNGCTIPTNPAQIPAREQSLKDTWTGVYMHYCCHGGITHDGRQLRNMSSGNFPNYFPGPGIARLRKAMAGSLYDSGAYMLGVEAARESIAQYYGVPPHRLFFSAGISDGIEMVHKLFLNNTMGRVLIPNESYSSHFSTAMTFGGKQLVATVGRDPETGIPDFSGCANGNNPFVHVGFSSFIPYDNPNPIVYPESFYRNGAGTGIFDLNERAFVEDGIIRPVVLDMIYQSFSWPERHVSISRIKELSEGKNILIFLNSISKVFLEPNKKAGVLAVHIPDAIVDYAEGSIIRDLESDFQRRLGIISNSSMAALVEAHRMLEEEKTGPVRELEALRQKARLRFIGEGGKGGNHALICSIPHVKPMHPGLKIESSGYNMYYIDAPGLPWQKPEYKKEVLGRLRRVMEAIPDEIVDGIPNDMKRRSALGAFDYYMARHPPEQIEASDIFCLDLAMETGLALVPGGRFYKLGTAPERVMFRPVLVADPKDFRESMDILGAFLEARLGPRAVPAGGDAAQERIHDGLEKLSRAHC